MNAAFELFGNTLDKSTFDILPNKEDFYVEEEVIKHRKGERYMYHLTPKFELAKKLIKDIAYAKVHYYYFRDEGNEKTTFLHSNRTEEDEKLFYDILKSIDYDCGYGLQQLFGTIVFKDGTWLSRWEYDGSEGWQRNSLPTEEEVCDT